MLQIEQRRIYLTSQPSKSFVVKNKKERHGNVGIGIIEVELTNVTGEAATDNSRPIATVSFTSP